MVPQAGNIYQNVLECIGNTPVVRLNKIPLEEGIQCEISKNEHFFWFYF
jgi:cysteine synthase